VLECHRRAVGELVRVDQRPPRIGRDEREHQGKRRRHHQRARPEPAAARGDPAHDQTLSATTLRRKRGTSRTRRWGADRRPRLDRPMAIADHRNGSPAPPPQNLEAEQSVLGPVLLSDTPLPARSLDERRPPEDFYRITGGFQAGNLIVLAARPGMGKSALMANLAEYAALNGKNAVALFSLEMSESELAQRFIASQASIKGDDLRKGKVPPARWPKILQASNRLAESPLYIDDSSDLSVLDVRAKARRLAQQNADGLGLILI